MDSRQDRSTSEPMSSWISTKLWIVSQSLESNFAPALKMIQDLPQFLMTMMTALHQLRSPPHHPRRHHHQPNLLQWQHHQPDDRPLHPPEHRQPRLLRQDFLLNPSTILILMQEFLNPNDQKFLYLSLPFLTETQPSLMLTFTPFPMLSMMPTSSLHPTRKFMLSLKQTQADE